jgi:5-methylcytosine-specific restriction protein A
MFRPQIKKITRSLLMQSSEGYCDHDGMPTRMFLESVARSIGGVPGFTSMPTDQLPPAICRRLGCAQVDLGVFTASNWPAWFAAVCSSTDKFFAKADRAAKRNNVLQMTDLGGLEGERQMVTHLRIERNSKIVSYLKENTSDKDYLGFIFCRACRIAPGAKFGVEVIEAHHVVPISISGIKKPEIKDFILVCPTCHSALHKGAKLELSHI